MCLEGRIGNPRCTQSTRTEDVRLEPRVVKTEEQYREYLAEIERLAAEDPVPGTPTGDRLEFLAKLVEDYEKGRFKFDRPDPVNGRSRNRE